MLPHDRAFPPSVASDVTPMKRFLQATAFAALSASMPPLSAADTPPLPGTVEVHATAPAALTAQDLQAWLDGLVPYALKKADLAGAVVVVVKDGALLAAKGYGYADVGKRIPVDPATTLFRPGSVSKLFMWTAVMQLVEQGKLDLDTDVNKYLDFTIPPRDGKPITLRDLMTHTAGFEEAVKNLIVRDIGQLKTNEAWLKDWIPERVYPAGEVSAYSNYGAALAGYIVQRASGMEFEDYVELHIYRPLGMRYATFRQPVPEPLAAHVAKSYTKASLPPLPFELVAAAPAGSMAVSGEDMGRFMIAHLHDGRFGDAQILRPETARQMHEYTHHSVPGLLPMALGFYHMDRNGQTIIGHGGATECFHSVLALYPKQDLGVFVSVNGAGEASGALRRQLLVGLTDRYFPVPDARPPTLATAREHGALLVGRYLSSRTSLSNPLSVLNLFTQPEITLDADGTLVTPDFRDIADVPRRWREVKPFVWLDDANGRRLGVTMQDGKVRWMAIDDTAPFSEFRPVPGWLSAAWNLPLLIFALLVFLATVVLWPIAALVRHSNAQPLGLEPAARRWYRWSRVAATVHLLYFAGWIYVLAQANSNLADMNTSFDGTLRAVQLLGVFAVVATAAAVGNAACAWRERSTGWWRRLNSLALLLACLATVWFSGSLHLLSRHLNY